MSGTQKVQDPGDHARKYGAFQSEIYANGMFKGLKPVVTTDPAKLEAQAKEAMTSAAFAYVAGGAGERATMDANRLAFRQWKIVPRMLQPTTHRDMSVHLWGEHYDSPVVASPIGVQSIFHPDGECGVAEVCAEIGVPYVASTASSHTMEDIAKANGNGPRWYQLYWPQHKPVTESLLKRAKSLNYKVLVVTLDTWALAWRPADLDNAFVPFIKGIGNQMGFSDPAFRKRFADENDGKKPEDDITAASMAWCQDIFSGAAHTWEELAHLREHWEGPIVLKGIQDPDDALKAIEHGMDGVFVSNHGGRQVDGAVGSLEMLPEVVEACRGKKGGIGENFVVMFDSGIRTGADIVKAVSLGAKMVGVGRPWVYGLGINGKFGARDALRGILADCDQLMGLAGMKNLAECTPKRLRKSAMPGDMFSVN